MNTTTTTIAQMAAFPVYSKEWFKAAFEGVNATPEVKDAAMMICTAYGITGQADAGYIANVITGKINHTSDPYFHQNRTNKTNYGV
jgi:hypothetical protein